MHFSELPTNRVFPKGLRTQEEGLTNGVFEVRPITRCNSAKTIQLLQNQDPNKTGFYNFRPLNNEKYHYVLPKDKDGERN